MLKAASGEGGDRLMDSGDLEKERGITITSKVTRLDYDGHVVNIVDTPGHADFAGEVDRILSMVDGVCLVVDASEGPMAQTKYVLSRALTQGLTPIVLINKVDRPDGQTRIDSGETENQISDLFKSLGATAEQLNYVTLYASAREGWVTEDPFVALSLATGDEVEEETGMGNLLDSIIEHIPEPEVYVHDNLNENKRESKDATAFHNDKFSLAATTVGFDQYLGRTCTGRIYSGSISKDDTIGVLKRGETDFKSLPKELADVCANRGISRVSLDPPTAYAGDIVTLVGVPDDIAVGDTITHGNNPVSKAIETPPLAPPTLCMDFGTNDGPYAGMEGTIVTSTRIRSRLLSETDNNVTISVQKCETDNEKSTVYGRGELQLGILIEQMRREGFEFIISPPKILTKMVDGVKVEPFEVCSIFKIISFICSF